MTGTKNNPQLTEEVEELKETVHDLQERIHYLERELEMSVDEQRFERQIKRLSVTDTDYEIEQNGMGQYRAIMNIPSGDLPHFTDRIEKMDGIGWLVEGADNGRIEVRVEEGLMR